MEENKYNVDVHFETVNGKEVGGKINLNFVIYLQDDVSKLVCIYSMFYLFILLGSHLNMVFCPLIPSEESNKEFFGCFLLSMTLPSYDVTLIKQQVI